MKKFADLSREERIAKIMDLRRTDVALILEDLVEDRNASAIIRSAESFGIGKVYVVQSGSVKTKISSNISSGASKWMEIEFFSSIEECVSKLKKDNFKIYGALVDPEAKPLWGANFSGKVAILVGNEPNGMSAKAKELMDENLYIPMYGLTESFNVSVSAGIFIYEVIRQKEES